MVNGASTIVRNGPNLSWIQIDLLDIVPSLRKLTNARSSMGAGRGGGEFLGHFLVFEITRVFSLETRVYSKLEYLKNSSFCSSLPLIHRKI